MIRALLTLSALLWTSCYTQTRPQPRAAEDAQVVPDEPVAAMFDTRPAGKPVRGDYQAQFDLERVALSVTAARNPVLVGDGRLAAMALTLARSIDPMADFDLLKLAPLARRRGIVNPLPQVVYAAAPTLAQIRALLIERTLPAVTKFESTHYGIAAKNRGALWVGVIVLDRRPLVLDPIPLHLDVPGTVRIHAQLLESLSEPTLIVTRPDGNAETMAHVTASAELDHTLSLTDGMWGIEIMGTGAHGPSVLANITVEVGTTSMTTAAPAKRDELAPRDERAFTRELARLISAERAQRGLPVLQRDAVLDQIALLHSTDMHDHSFFGHVSASTGGPGDRALRGGARAWRLHENVARGYTPRDVHEGLMNSPGHRKAILLSHADMLGLGVTTGYEGGAPVFFVTELFAQTPHSIALEEALEHVARRISEARSAQKLSPVIPDTRLSGAAQRTAVRFFTTAEGSDAEQQALLNELMQQARAPRGARGMSARLYLGGHPADLPIQDEMLDPKVRWVGLGVAQGEHARTGPAGLAVVVLLAH